MKQAFFILLTLVALGFSSCQSEMVNEFDSEVEAQLGKNPPSPWCATAFMFNGIIPGSSEVKITNLTLGQVVGTFTNGTAYLNLLPSSQYLIEFLGTEFTNVSWCSCNNNLGSVQLNNGGTYTLTTSGTTTPYASCSF